MRPKAERNAAAVETALKDGVDRAEAVLALYPKDGLEPPPNCADQRHNMADLVKLRSDICKLIQGAKTRLHEELIQQVRVSQNRTSK